MNVYFKGEESICIGHRSLQLKDIGEICCADPEMTRRLEGIRLYVFPESSHGRVVLSIVKIVDEIKKLEKTLEVVNLGPMDFIVYYKRNQTEPKWVLRGKICFVCLTAFFGAAISIMAYNNDVGMKELFAQVYEWVMGRKPAGPGVLEISYSIGLAVGILVFFNHVARKRLSDEPTPFEVQMRLYEKDVNQTLITGASRKEEEIE